MNVRQLIFHTHRIISNSGPSMKEDGWEAGIPVTYELHELP